jgi:hypothetical protein
MVASLCLNSFYAFLELVFFLWHSFIDIGQAGKKLCFAKEKLDSVLVPDSTRVLAAIWKALFSTGPFVCRWIDTQQLVWRVYMLAMNKTREQFDDALSGEELFIQNATFHRTLCSFSFSKIVLLST